MFLGRLGSSDLEKQHSLETVSSEVLQEYRAIFNFLDRDGSGEISWDELGHVLWQIGCRHNPKELKKMIRSVDQSKKYPPLSKKHDGNGTEQTTTNRRHNGEFVDPQEISRSELRAAFDLFDSNRDGFISIPELLRTMNAVGQHVTSQELWLLMDEVDTDQDGTINFEEFVRVMQDGPPSFGNAEHRSAPATTGTADIDQTGESVAPNLHLYFSAPTEVIEKRRTPEILPKPKRTVGESSQDISSAVETKNKKKREKKKKKKRSSRFQRIFGWRSSNKTKSETE